MTAPRIISLIFVLFLAVVGELCAQDTLVVPGARVRVYSPDRLTGTIEMLSRDTLVLKTEASRYRMDQGRVVAWRVISRQAIPFASITRLEVTRGKKSKWLVGAVVGLGLGAAATVAFLAGFCDDSDTSCEGDEYLNAFALIALPPAIVGAVIGALIKVDRWEDIPLDGIRVSLRPNDHLGVAISVRIVF